MPKPKKTLDAAGTATNAEDAWFHSLGDNAFAAEWAGEEDECDYAYLSAPGSEVERGAPRPATKTLTPP